MPEPGHTDQTQTGWKAPFFTIWTGQQLSWIGSSVAQFALVWWVSENTGSATVLATAALVASLPGILLGPFVGALVDRWDRRIVMIVSDALIAAVSAWLAYLFWQGTLEIWHVYVIMLVRALGSAFHWPAMRASTSLMVPKEHMARMGGLNQTVGGAVNVVSPPLGALLLSVLPLHTIMAIDVLTAAFAIAPLFFVSVPQPWTDAQGTAPRQATLWTDMRAGLRYMWGWPGLLALCVLAMVLNFFGNPVFTLVPILVTRHFGGGAWHVGALNSAWGLGLVAGGAALGVWGGFRRRILTVLLGIVGTGSGVLVVGLTPSALFPVAVVAMFVSASMNAMTNGSAFALLQVTVAPEMQGRVFTVIMSLTQAMVPLGMALAAPVVDALGIRTLYIAVGVVPMVLGAASLFVPTIMHLEDNNRGNEVGMPLPRERPAATI